MNIVKRFGPLAGLIATLLTTTTLAAVPETFPVQGLLTTSAGQPAPDGSYVAVFTIWDDETDGAQLWKETLGIVVADGVFSAVLGRDIVLPTAAFDDGTARWLQVQLGTEPPLPRRSLDAVPYALVSRRLGCTGCVDAAHLDAASVQALVASWGFVHASALAPVATSGTFASLSAIPADLADGDDDTKYTGANFALSGQACTAGRYVTGTDANGLPVCSASSNQADNAIGWMTIHASAAAACRGSTASGGTGCCGNSVRVRNTSSALTCTQICSGAGETCDAEVSVWGRAGKATANGELVGSFYNYGCGNAGNGGSEVNAADGDAQTAGYWSFCCCRK
ncbi:MAG: hypothetical protein IV100_05760 [Myxococcales bacterium]|nr:hypothetical protein [Myxococcales bacterium]